LSQSPVEVVNSNADKIGSALFSSLLVDPVLVAKERFRQRIAAHLKLTFCFRNDPVYVPLCFHCDAMNTSNDRDQV